MEDNIIVETVQNEDGTQTLVPIAEPVEPDEVDQTDVIPNEESTEDSDGKLGLAVLALGGAAIAGVTAVVVNKIKNKRAAKNAEENPDEDAKPKKIKKGKRVKAVVPGRKLTLAERLHGCELNPVEPKEDAPAEEDEAN